MTTSPAKLKVLVSSTVYGNESILRQVYGILDSCGYEVWMSEMGTIPNWSGNHAFTDCLQAVDECDLFLSIITPQYGSGVVGGGKSITHQELERAIRRKVPRWVMAHERVTLARSFFKKLGRHTANARKGLLDTLGFADPGPRKRMVKRESKIIDDFRVIDMYDLASQQAVANIMERRGNWVQEFKSEEDIKRYVSAQLGDYDRIVARVATVKKATTTKRKSGKTPSTGRRQPRKKR